MALGSEGWGLSLVDDIEWYSTELAPVSLDFSSLLFSVPNVGGVRRLATLREFEGDPSRTLWGRRSVSTKNADKTLALVIIVGDPGGSPAAGECFSDASIANTIRAGVTARRGKTYFNERLRGRRGEYLARREAKLASEREGESRPETGNAAEAPPIVWPIHSLSYPVGEINRFSLKLP